MKGLRKTKKSLELNKEIFKVKEQKVNHSAVPYPKTGQFRNAIQNVKAKYTFKGLDEQNKAIYDPSVLLPVVPYIATVKVHGTNASLVMFKDQAIYCQSKERTLAFGCDNAGFWEAMQSVDKEDLFHYVKTIFSHHNPEKEIMYPVVIAGEWYGKGIQKGVAVSELPKTFMIFGVKFGEEWQPMLQYKNLSDHKSNIHNALDFDHWFLDIDFNNPQDIQNKIIKLTHQVEAECPVGKHFGVSGIGEGIVLKPLDGELSSNSGYFFKSKGEKHSSSKVKKLASVDTEKLNSIREFVEYSVTESRLEQAVTEVGLDVKLMGSFIKWIMQDIFKEESDTMRDNGIELKAIGKPVSDIARRFYLNKINSQF